MSKRNTSWGWNVAKKVKEKTGGKCAYCGCDLPPDKHDYDGRGLIVVSYRQWDIDHVMPVSRGGKNNIENLLPACKKCNSKKRSKTISEFLGEPT